MKKKIRKQLSSGYDYSSDDIVDFRMRWLDDELVITISRMVTEKSAKPSRPDRIFEYIYSGHTGDLSAEILNKLMMDRENIKKYKKEKRMTYRTLMEDRENMLLSAKEYGLCWDMADKAFAELESKLEPEAKLLLEIIE